jgi:hypothetical protein
LKGVRAATIRQPRRFEHFIIYTGFIDDDASRASMPQVHQRPGHFEFYRRIDAGIYMLDSPSIECFAVYFTHQYVIYANNYDGTTPPQMTSARRRSYREYKQRHSLTPAPIATGDTRRRFASRRLTPPRQLALDSLR